MRIDISGLRRQRTVNMGLESDAVLVNFTRLGQRKNLETARVRQDGFVPVHKAVQTAHFRHQFIPRPQKEVIGIREDHLRAQFFHLGRGQGFYGCLGADRRENGCAERAVRRCKGPGARAPIGGVERPFKSGHLASFKTV